MRMKKQTSSARESGESFAWVSDLARLERAGVRADHGAELLRRMGSLESIATMTVDELRATGLPKRMAEAFGSAMQIGRAAGSARRATLGCAQDAFNLLRARVAELQQEVFWVIPIDVRNGVIGDAIEVARGTVSSVEVHPREVFRVGVRLAAAGMVVVHNHPSGDPTPSSEDIALTRRLVGIGKLLGIPVIDHVVIAGDRYRSIAEEMGSSFKDCEED